MVSEQVEDGATVRVRERRRGTHWRLGDERV